METTSGGRGSSQLAEGGAIRRLVTLVGAQLLGLRVSTVAGAEVPPRWWDQRGSDSLWRELSLEPMRRDRSIAEETPRSRKVRGRKLFRNADKCAATAVVTTSVGVAVEDKIMQKSGSIGKFLQIGSVVQGGQRTPRWFSLPGSWRVPRVQIMRQHDQVHTAEYVEQRVAHPFSLLAGRGG